MRECPKCGVDISGSYQGAEPDVGIMGGGWYCNTCNLAVSDEDGPESHDDDVQIFGTPSDHTVSFSGVCQYCQTPLEFGYGLAGGGMGLYMYCPAQHCGKTFIKSQEPRNA